MNNYRIYRRLIRNIEQTNEKQIGVIEMKMHVFRRLHGEQVYTKGENIHTTLYSTFFSFFLIIVAKQ